MENDDNTDYISMIDGVIDNGEPFETRKRKSPLYRVTRLKFALSTMQVKDLLARAREHSEKYGMIVEFQVKTGLRIDEVANMTVENIDFNLFVVLVSYVPESEETEEWTGKTVNAYRQVKLNKKLAFKLRDFLQKNGIISGYIFRPYRGNERRKKYNKRSLINLVNSIARECTSIGRTIGTHTLRRTYASFLLKAGVSITTIQKLLGHKKLKTTFDYLKEVYDPDTDDLVEKATEMM